MNSQASGVGENTCNTCTQKDQDADIKNFYFSIRQTT